MSEFYSSKLNSFGTASIPKLVLQFSVPSIISMLVNALYKEFYNNQAQIVIDYCEKNNKQYHIKNGTIT